MPALLVDKYLPALGDLVAPPRCAWCGSRTTGNSSCDPCTNRLPWNRNACDRCAIPSLSTAAARCARCAARPPPQDRTWTAFEYRTPISTQVLQLKFHARLQAAALLADLMARALAMRPSPLPRLLIPVPLHYSRLRRRGYNQALEISRPLARRLSLDLDSSIATRVRPTHEQTALSAAGRRHNVRGAFRVGPQVQGQHIALVDDVITTGATAAELARVAKAAGATRVEAWAVARA